MNSENLLKTPLYEQHIKSNAKMIEFGGWLMPVQYEGIIKEHMETRNNVSIFDTCHMGEFICKGDGAEEALSHILTADIKTLKKGRCRYGFILNENAGIIDDCITYRTGQDAFMIIVNASKIQTDYNRIKANINSSVEFIDVSKDTGKIDIQGPASQELIEKLFAIDLRGLSYFESTSLKWKDFNIALSRTGYTGEKGYEVYCNNNAVAALWNELIDMGIKPAGLGARDTLRLEAGLPLYGHEFTENITPADSAFKKFASKKTGFIGKDALSQINPDYILTGLKLDTRQSARHLNKIYSGSREAGWVTSGSFAPSLGYSICLAYIKKDIKAEKLEIDTGKKRLYAQVCDFPFYRAPKNIRC